MGKYIDKLGFEIEGIWKERKPIDGFRIDVDSTIERRKASNDTERLEYVSHPFEYKSRETEPIWSSIHELYDMVAEINDSMGLHIHVSMTKKGYIPCLTSLKFYNHFMNTIRNNIDMFKGKNKERLKERMPDRTCTTTNKKYSYCQGFDGRKDFDEHLNGKKRYRKINYFVRNYSGKGDIEIRLFPAMTNVIGIKKAYKLSTRAINSFLHKKRPPQDIASEEIEVEGDVEEISLSEDIITV